MNAEEKLIAERKKDVVKFTQKHLRWFLYAFLALIVYLAVYIRTLPMKINPMTGKPGLWDIARDQWTLGPDLDPFLFLRWAKEIISNGSLAAVDHMRYVPLGFPTKAEVLLHPYLMAWFHQAVSALGFSSSIEYSAVIFPVFMFVLAVIAFFFMVKALFEHKVGKTNAMIIGLVAALFLTIVPALLPRTIAGIPEKEASGLVFLFLTFYLFIKAWNSKSLKWQIGLAVLAGAVTAGMALVWGGYVYIFATLSIVMLITFILGQVDLRRFYVYCGWLVSASVIMYLSSTRYTPGIMLSSSSTAPAYALLLIIGIHFAIWNTKLKSRFEGKTLSKLPPQIITAIISAVLFVILASIMFGPSYLPAKVDDVYHTLVRPISDRLGVTVAENRQPYYTEWAGSFGPQVGKIPLFFWLFFVGSIYLFYHLTEVFKKKERAALTGAYALFLFTTVFSRYSPESALNGENFISSLFYFGGFLILLGAFGYYYYTYHQKKEEGQLKNIDFGMILLFAFFFLAIVSARGAVRLIMMLVPPGAAIVGYFAVMIVGDSLKIKDSTGKMLALLVAAVVVVATAFSAYAFYQSSAAQAEYQIPSSYTQQWQKAMGWVRENTPENAVFGHWWDYGYWVQTMGERSTILDGGNYIVYWNYLMGRHALTGPDNRPALEYLYAHNATHFLIDSSDIGKYSAFSSIGSDENYDRASWISTFGKNPELMQETKNSTIYVYTGGTVLDGDILYEQNGSRIFLPGGSAGVGGVFIERDKSGKMIGQPEGVYVYQGKQYRIPLRYVYDNGNFTDFGKGLDAGVFIYPRLLAGNGGYQIENDGALMYLSNRTVKSQLARLYLYEENNPYFEQVHSQDDIVVESIKAQNPAFKSDFVEYQGLRGPIRIWEIHYPEDIEVKEEYLQMDYPNPDLTIAR